MRTVIDNNRLRRLRDRDLPDDGDLSNSCWTRVDYSDRDLSGFNMTDMDMFDCVGQRAVFPTGRTALIQMRESAPEKRLVTLDDAVLDTDSSSYSHQFVVEGMRQCANADHPITIFVRDYVAADYSHSWRDALYEAIQLFGQQEVYDALLVAFAAFPRWLTRLEFHFEHESWGPLVPWETDLSAVSLIGDRGSEYQFDLRFQLVTKDRWQLARSMENAIIASPTNDIVRLKFWPAQTDPKPVLLWADHSKWRAGEDAPDLPQGVRNG